MEEQGLRPGVQHGDRAWGGSQPPLAHRVERPDCSLEEQSVAAAPVRQEKRVQRRRHREDQVEVGHWEQLLLLRLDPPGLLQALALGTMPIPTGVVERLLAATVVAHLEVAAQKRGSTAHDVPDHSATFSPEFFGRRRVRLENCRQLRRAARLGRHHLPRLGLPQRVQRAARVLEVVARHVGIALRRVQTAMAQERLDRSHVHARLQELRGKAVAQ